MIKKECKKCIKCSKCKEIKPLSEFVRRASRKKGFMSECKKCSNKRNRIYYKKTNKK